MCFCVEGDPVGLSFFMPLLHVAKESLKIVCKKFGSNANSTIFALQKHTHKHKQTLFL